MGADGCCSLRSPRGHQVPLRLPRKGGPAPSLAPCLGIRAKVGASAAIGAVLVGACSPSCRCWAGSILWDRGWMEAEGCTGSGVGEAEPARC